MRNERSSHIRNDKMMQLMRHLADVASHSNDPTRQRQTLIDGLNTILNTQLGVWFSMDDWRPRGSPRPVQTILTSKPDPNWVRYIGEFSVAHPATDDPYADHSIHSPASTQLWQLKELVRDRASRRRYGSALDMADKLKVCDGVVSIMRVGTRGDRIVGFSLQRRVEAGKLTPRDIALARLAITEINAMHRRRTLRFEIPEPKPLSPRLRQTLDLLLDGESPSSMARTLGLSLHTVREHIDRLYRQYGVHSREELTARFVR